jgi:hypothetical protein
MNGECHGVLAGLDGLVRELEVQRLRTAVAVEVSPRLWEFIGDDGLVGPVVSDIVDRWMSRPGGLALTGRDGFTAAYVEATERDGAGRPWPQLSRLRDVGGGWVADEQYPRRVWTYHARRLVRLYPADAAGTTVVADPLPDGPAGDLVVERLRTQVAVEVAAAVPDWLARDAAAVTAIVGDVVARWFALPAGQRPVLTGHGRFTEEYVSRVLYDEPADEVLRAEFRGPDGQGLDMDAYLRVVWTHHVARLAGAR